MPNGQLLLSGETDDAGNVDFGHLAGEHYRIVVWKLQSGKPQRFGFDQPTPQLCEGTAECSVHYVLNATPTDQAVNLCPPK
jgi:hypothetical protein